MAFTFLNWACNASRPETINIMNSALTGYAITEGMIGSEKQRVDTTAYETNIH